MTQATVALINAMDVRAFAAQALRLVQIDIAPSSGPGDHLEDFSLDNDGGQ
jgi:hypothetical protein